jgi:hypothetical protein
MELIVKLLISAIEFIPLLCFGCMAMAVMIASVLYMFAMALLKLIFSPFKMKVNQIE